MRAEFSNATKLAAWFRAHGYCEQCGIMFGGKRSHYDHIIPCAFGGSNELDNCQLICTDCHRKKTGSEDIPAIAKSNRVRLRHAGIRRKRAILAWRNFAGEIVRKPRNRDT